MVVVVVEAEWWLISQVAAEAGVAEQTCFRYAKTFPEYFDARKVGRVTKYNPDGVVEKIHYIKELYGQGKNKDEIRDLLVGAGFNVTVDMETQGEETMPVLSAPSLTLALLAQIAGTLDKLVSQEQQIAELKDQVAGLIRANDEVREWLRGQRVPWWRFWGK